MNRKMIWSNLAISDLERTTKFYSELGFKSNGSSKELTSFFVGEDDFVMHFLLKDILKANIKGELADTKDTNEVLFTLSAESNDQVNNWAEEPERAGGTNFIWKTFRKKKQFIQAMTRKKIRISVTCASL